MITFDTEELEKLLKRKSTSATVNTVWLIAAAVMGIICAILSKDAENDWTLYLALLCVCVAALIGLGAFNIFYVLRLHGKLKSAIARQIADGFYASESILKGERVELTVDYNDNYLTVSRKDYTGEITVNPFSSAKIDGVGKVEFDLTALKKAPSIYGSAGTFVWDFLQAYYFKALDKGIKTDSVVVTDNMGKTPLILTVVENGKPSGNEKKNRFLKEGIIK